MSDGGNFPKSVQIDKPNQYQKGFFPFSAWSSDDPNVTANPTLTLNSLWKLAGNGKGLLNALVDQQVLSIGEQLRRLLRIGEARTAADIADKLEFLSNWSDATDL